MGLLANSILAGEAPFAYLIFISMLAKIYVPFVDVTSAANATTQTCFGVADRSAQLLLALAVR